MGPHLDAFEAELEALTGVHAVAVSSGTAALRLALHLIGVGPGDEVWAPSLTFIGTVGPVVHLGATPVFFDCDARTWNMDPALVSAELELANAQGRLPKAVIPVDLYGQCADYDAIEAACASYGVPVVSDAAEAVGATWGGRPAGSFGDFAAFSFNGNKIATSSGGGALLTASGDMAKRARSLATQAREPTLHYEHREVGYNDRLSNLCAAVGLGQVRGLAERIGRRQRIRERYAAALADLPFVRLQPVDPRGTPNHWLTCATLEPSAGVPTPAEVCATLARSGVEARPTWKPMHLQPVFDKARMMGGAVAEEIFATGLCLPSGSGMTERVQDRVVDLLRKSLLNTP